MGALVVLSQLERTNTIHNTFNIIVALYQQQGPLEMALENYNKALTNHARPEFRFEPDVADGLEILGLCYSQAGEFKKSLTCYAYSNRIREALMKN